MWLGLCGLVVGRKQAMRWFGAEPASWDGAGHALMARVIATHLPSAAGGWRRHRLVGSTAFVAALGQPLAMGWPALVTAMCELREPVLRCRHAFVVTNVDSEVIDLIDPLGRRPAVNSPGNARYQRSGLAKRRLDIEGARWRLDLSCNVQIFMPSMVASVDAQQPKIAVTSPAAQAPNHPASLVSVSSASDHTCSR